MAYFLTIPEFVDTRGSLFVCDKLLPFEIKRFYFMKEVNGERGGCKHLKSIQALVSIEGGCTIDVQNGNSKFEFILDNPSKLLVIEQGEWHELRDFHSNAIVLILSSEHYNKEDYCYVK